MKNSYSAAFAFLFAVIIIAIASVVPAASAAPEWTPEQKEIITIMETWQRAYDTGDAVTLDRLLADEIDFTSVSLKGTFKDKTAYLAAYKKWAAVSKSLFIVPDQNITFKEVKISGDEAFVSREIYWSRRGERGLQSGTLNKTARLIRLNGEWRIQSEK